MITESLTDYQIRDLNDEINQLMREKRHFETQIVSLGGANYKRGQQAMTDDDGKEVPGTRGYKYVSVFLFVLDPVSYPSDSFRVTAGRLLLIGNSMVDTLGEQKIYQE